MLENPRRPIAKWHTLKNITCEPQPDEYFIIIQLPQFKIQCCFFSAEKSSRLERFVPKRGNLSKALSVDASDARHKIFKLKKNKSVDDRQELKHTQGIIYVIILFSFPARSRAVSLSVVSESSESTGRAFIIKRRRF